MTLRWLGHDVSISLCGHTLSPLVGITWRDATSGAWVGSRVLDPDELEQLVDAIEGISCGDVVGDDLPPIDLEALIAGVLDR